MPGRSVGHGRAPVGRGTQLFSHRHCPHPRAMTPACKQGDGLEVLWLWAPLWDPRRPSESSQGGKEKQTTC